MHYSYLIPEWFFGFDIAMEILFSIATIALSIVAMKVYKITKERKTKLFAIAFALIGVSYLIWAAANLWFVDIISDGFRGLSFESIVLVESIAAYAFMILFTLGLVNIVYISCDLKDTRTFVLIFGLSLMVLAASHYKLVTFRILSVFLLLFIVGRYLNEYFQKKTGNSLIVLIAFTLLLLGSIDFMLTPLFYQAYIIGHFLELMAYLMLLAVLIKSLRK